MVSSLSMLQIFLLLIIITCIIISCRRDSTPQEILVSTPRRFGKTISVSMFAAAMIFSAPTMELSIYSTCKRISQKLLRNIVKFLDLIYLELGVPPYKVLRMNSEVRLLLLLNRHPPQQLTDTLLL